jgi:protein MpaA
LIIILVILSGCSIASAADSAVQEISRPSAPHGALSLPPAWTPTMESQPSRSHSGIDQDPQTTPTPDLGTPLNMYQEYIVIGTSVEGQPLEVYRFGSGPRDLMIVAGIHGGYEWNTIVLADEFIEFLYQNPETIPPRLSIHILRNLNPDGATLKGSPWGRGNANHVDLNRNWDSSWSEDVPKPNCWDLVPLTSGPHPGSEPEIQALMQYILDANIKALISYHSAGLGIFAGGKPSTEISLSLAEAVAAVSDYPYPPIDFGCEYTGTLADWAADNGIAAIDIELSTHWDTDLEQNLIILETFFDWLP